MVGKYMNISDGLVFTEIDPKMLLSLVSAGYLPKSFQNIAINAMREKRSAVLDDSQSKKVQMALDKFQRSHDLKITGKLDPPTTRKLMPYFVEIKDPLIVKAKAPSKKASKKASQGGTRRIVIKDPLVIRVKAPITKSEAAAMIKKAIDANNFDVQSISCSGSTCAFTVAVYVMRDKKRYRVAGVFSATNDAFKSKDWKDMSKSSKVKLLHSAVKNSERMKDLVAKKLAPPLLEKIRRNSS